MLKRTENAGEEKHLVKAIIPAAGVGTRLRPFTLSVPKELLPVNRKPMIQLAVEEALASGITEIGIVIRKGKEAIQLHFEALIASSSPLCETLKGKLSQADMQFIFQKDLLGLGNAIYQAGSYIDDSPFVMIIPDQFVHSRVPATRQLLDAASENFKAVWSSLVAVSANELQFFPGVRRFNLFSRVGNTWEVAGFQEDSGGADEKNFVGFGRTYFPAGVIDFFSERFLNPATGEVDLLLSFEALIKERQNYAVLLEGKAMDFGTWVGYENFSPDMNVSFFNE